jgi:hypothetical protein
MTVCPAVAAEISLPVLAATSASVVEKRFDVKEFRGAGEKAATEERLRMKIRELFILIVTRRKDKPPCLEQGVDVC